MLYFIYYLRHLGRAGPGGAQARGRRAIGVRTRRATCVHQG